MPNASMLLEPTSFVENNSAVSSPIKRKSPPKGVVLFNDVEVKPKFKEENAVYEFRKFFRDEINYPIKAMENGAKGVVLASYIVNERGMIEDIEVEVNADQSLAKEVVRVLNKSSAWIPGKQNGKNVSVQCYIFTEFIIRK